MSMLRKHRVILTKLVEHPITGDVQFAQHIDDDEDYENLGTGVFLMNETWEDMGKPDTIAVTVEPGGKLNAAN